jgi:hypothetical protein
MGVRCKVQAKSFGEGGLPRVVLADDHIESTGQFDGTAVPETLVVLDLKGLDMHAPENP